MVFEMTRDYSIIVPLMISNLVSFFISRTLQPEPIYEALAHQEGVYLPSSEARESGAGMRVSEVVRGGIEMLSPDDDAARAREVMAAQGCGSWPVGIGGIFAGMARLQDLEDDKPLKPHLIHTPDAFVHPDQSAAFALERMRSNALDVLPVFTRTDLRQLKGIVTMRGILDAYQTAHHPEIG
jgi:CIC family chloride channel protein